MPGTVGSGSYTYELVDGWGTLPDGWSFYEVVGVAVDSRQQVYVFNRGEHPVIVFDSDGNVQRSWGEGFFARPHGICIGPDDAVYCVDDLGHTVHRFSPTGELLLTLGVRGTHSDTGYTDEAPKVLRGAGPFHGPTNVAVAPDGSFYVSDGYRNACVHKFASDGRLLLSWGEPGSGPGQFMLPHGIAVGDDGVVYVGDRANNRIQLFGPDGDYRTEWRGLSLPCDVHVAGDHAYVAELGTAAGRPVAPGSGPGSRVSVLSLDGLLLARWGERRIGSDPCEAGNFAAAHGIRADAGGDLYVGEVSQTASGRSAPAGCHVLQKFRRLRVS
jgi:DNA-binding beta-propeller fold protein YncE